MLERVEVLEGGRKELRRDVRMSCELVSEYWDESLPFNLVDLSPSGAFVESQLPLGTGDEVELRFSPPRSKALYWLRGRVVRSSLGRRDAKHDVPGMGIEFFDLSNTDRSSLSRQLVGIPPRVPLRSKGGIVRPNKSIRTSGAEMMWVEELLVDELAGDGCELTVAFAGMSLDALGFAPTAIAPLLTAGRGRAFC